MMERTQDSASAAVHQIALKATEKDLSYSLIVNALKSGCGAVPADPRNDVDPRNDAIPTDEERPCYRVFDEPVTLNGQSFAPGVVHFWISMSKKGETNLRETWICGPIRILAVTTDNQDNNFGAFLRFRTRLGGWRTWPMPMEMLSGDGKELRATLLSMGLAINLPSRYQLSTYLQMSTPESRLLCVSQTGWADRACETFVLPESAIGRAAGQVVFQSGEVREKEYMTQGTFKAWKKEVAGLAAGNPMLVLALSAAFVGPLLAICNEESGGIHFVGDSSIGKSTGLFVACSVWGSIALCRSWKTTGNGLEGIAAMSNDNLLALDEINECEPGAIGSIIYALGNGRGKQRASRTGAARPLTRWRCFVLSSGERTIETCMTEGGFRIKAGQSVRVLDVPVQRVFGTWDELHGRAGGTELSDDLKRSAAAHYGHAGLSFLAKLTAEGNVRIREMFEVIKDRPEFQPRLPEDGQAKRASKKFALLATAGELATSFGVTGWAEGSAIEAAGIGFASWQSLRGKGGRSAREGDQILRQVSAFLERHGDSRFSDIETETTSERTPLIRDRAGWWQDKNDRRTFLFTTEGMHEALKGFDFPRALDILEEAGAVVKAADGKRSIPRRIDHRSVRVYAVDASKLDCGSARWD